MDVPLVLPLPVGHGLTLGQGFTIMAGESETHGHVVISCPPDGPDCEFTVADDRSATHPGTGGLPTFRIVDLVPGLGLSLSDAVPVVASTADDTLAKSLENAANVFPTLNATLYRAEGTGLSTDFAVDSIQLNAQGDYVISYTLDGTLAEVTITPDDFREDFDNYRVDVDGARFFFWFRVPSRNLEFSRYMDSATLVRHDLDAGVSDRAWFIFGVRTETPPSMGSATYLGRFEARAYRSDDPDHDERQHITGAMRLVANFDVNQLDGAIDAIRSRVRNRSGDITDWPESRFEITEGRIVNGQFTATLIGRGDANLDQSLKDFTGSILGEFYGPDADEVGAVVAAERPAVGSDHGRNLYGYVVGRNTAPFADEARENGLHPLSGKVFGSGEKVLIVMAHGTGSSGRPAETMYPHAEDIAERFPNATVAAVLGAGHYDRDGRVSPGSNHERRNWTTPVNNDLLATTIRNLTQQHSPEHVVVVGHSGGARQLGVLIGRVPNLMDGAVLVGGEYRRGPSRLHSEIPLEAIDEATLDTSVKVVAVSGTEDETNVPEESVNYVRILKDLGLDAELKLIKGEGHNYGPLHNVVVSAIGELLNKLESGLGDGLIDRSYATPQLDSAALMTGVDRDRTNDSTTFSGRQMAAVESTEDGFRITYVVDGQMETVELDEGDIGANPSRPNHYSKTTNGTEFRLRLNAGDRAYEHLEINTWGVYSSSARSYGHLIYGARTADMPSTGTASYEGVARAIEWPDANVGTGSGRVTHFRGELRLNADFASSGVAGTVTNLESRPGNGDFREATGGITFSGVIDRNGISGTDLSGSGVLAHYSDGSVNGALYGPGGAEVAGVFEAKGTDTTGDRLLTGYFAGEKQ